jgi:hypothetical protein
MKTFRLTTLFFLTMYLFCCEGTTKSNNEKVGNLTEETPGNSNSGGKNKTSRYKIKQFAELNKATIVSSPGRRNVDIKSGFKNIVIGSSMDEHNLEGWSNEIRGYSPFKIFESPNNLEESLNNSKIEKIEIIYYDSVLASIRLASTNKPGYLGNWREALTNTYGEPSTTGVCVQVPIVENRSRATVNNTSPIFDLLSNSKNAHSTHAIANWNNAKYEELRKPYRTCSVWEGSKVEIFYCKTSKLGNLKSGKPGNVPYSYELETMEEIYFSTTDFRHLVADYNSGLQEKSGRDDKNKSQKTLNDL